MSVSASDMSAMPAAMNTMEHPESTISVPPLVDERILINFCNAVQTYADSVGSHDEVAEKLCELQARLASLRGLASLCRLAIAGHPLSFARVIDEMHCISVDFSCDPLKEHDAECEMNEDEPDDRVQLAAAIDLFAGAAFVSKDELGQRDRFIIGIVRAIENAMAFPVVYAAETAAYLGKGAGGISPTHASIVIGNAAQRLIEGDQKCVPRVPAEVRLRLECLARQWMCANPVTEFFKVISGPKVCRIVHWEDPSRDQPDDALVGDPVTLLLRPFGGDKAESADCGCGEGLRDLGVMFCPHQPAEVVRVVENGLQVKVPESACTGPVAVVRKTPDFTSVWNLIVKYAQEYPVELASSVFSSIRMDVWAYPVAFGRPIIEIRPTPQTVIVGVFNSAGQVKDGQQVAANDTVAIQYRVVPAGSDGGSPPTVNAPGGVVTQSGVPGLLLYQPSAPGDTPVELTWGSVKVTVPVSVKAAAVPGGGRP